MRRLLRDGRQLRWANSGANKISYANLDGSGGGHVATGLATVNRPAGVAIDPAAGRIYWANSQAGHVGVSFVKLDGTGGADVTTTGATKIEAGFPRFSRLPPGAGPPRSQARRASARR
jgi:DNA-binding beta-propeller fold protein YncE